MIKPWIFEFFPSYDDAPGQPAPDNFAWHLDLWTRAEDIGFEGVFFSEHHFAAGLNSPSPNLLIAAVAQRTQRLRLGVMGMVLPLYAPWRAAEEVAMLDHLTCGRLEIGVSSGAGPMEIRAVGIPVEEARPRFDEALEVIEAALDQPSFTHKGQFYAYQNLSIVPRPLQSDPRRWMTCMSEATAAKAGARGYCVCTGFVTTAQAKVLFDAHAAAAEAAGRPSGPQRVALRRQILVADTDAQAKSVAAEATAKLMAMMSNLGATRTSQRQDHTPSGAPDAPPTPRGLFFGEDETIAGSPSAVAEQIIEQCHTSGAGHMLAYPFITARRDQVARSYELWRTVAATLRRA
jgi:alkanesulfonate monooxygenase SsuD/methylene tetrahydromethanopterin reductase-like flavin-dependent oxidoreductase (luciferase family)